MKERVSHTGMLSFAGTGAYRPCPNEPKLGRHLGIEARHAYPALYPLSTPSVHLQYPFSTPLGYSNGTLFSQAVSARGRGLRHKTPDDGGSTSGAGAQPESTAW